MNSDANTSSSQALRPSARLHLPPPRRRRYLKAGLLLFCSLAAGYVLGVSSAVLYFKSAFDKRRERPSTAEVAKSIADRMEQSVSMTPAEREKISGFIEQHMDQVESIRQSSFELIWDELDKMNADVAEVLGPERNRAWEADKDKHFGEKRRQFNRRHGRHGEPPPPPPPGPPPGRGRGRHGGGH